MPSPTIFDELFDLDSRTTEDPRRSLDAEPKTETTT